MKLATVGIGRLARTRWAVLMIGVAFLATTLAIATRTQGAEPKEAVAQGPVAIGVKTAPVTEGKIATNLTYSGDVKAVSQVAVLPKGSGRIEKMMIEVGSRVKKGDPLAELDADSLRTQVGQATAALAAAEAKYSSLESGARTEQVGQARAALDQAEARRDAVLKGAKESDVAAGQSQVDGARAGLANAKAALDRVKMGATQAELAAVQAAVDQSKLAIKKAQADLDELKAGPKDYELWAAQNAVDAARSTLDAANDRVQTWKNGDTTDAEKMASGATSASQAETGRQAAQTALDAAVAKLNYLKGKPYPNEVQAAETALYTALASFESSKAKLEQLQRGPTAQDIQQAEAAVQAAEATLAGAEARVKALQDGATEEEKRQAEAAVAQARQAYGLASKPYTKEDLAQARAGVEQARAALELAELALKESVVVSPIDGVVAGKQGSVGALVSPATPIATLVSPEVELTLAVEEGQIGQVKEGQLAQISVTAYPGEAFRAKVALIAPTADPKTRTFEVKVRPEVEEGKLRQGMFAQVRIVTQEKDRVLLVPKEALVTRGGQTLLFALKDDVAQQRQVKLGLSQDGTVEVLSGVEAGEEVVVAGGAQLRDGDKVNKR